MIGCLGVIGAVSFGPRHVGLLAMGYCALSLTGLVWIYVLTPYDLDDYMSTNAERVVTSVIFGLAALAPLPRDEQPRAGATMENPSDSQASLGRHD